MDKKEQSEKEEGRVAEAFARALTDVQEMLSIYVRTLMGGAVVDAQDVLQETNLELMKHAGEFPRIRSFPAWAKKTALLQVRKYRLYRAREGFRVLFDDTVFEAVVAKLAAEDSLVTDRLTAFNHCLGRLKPEDRELLNRKYLDCLSSAELARHGKTTEGAINTRLHKIRAFLEGCMRKAFCRLNIGGDL